jgi:hypothetical protein
MTARNLIVCPVGQRSLHHHWSEQQPDTYDIAAIVYDDSAAKHAGTAKYIYEQTGTKFEILSWFFTSHPEIWKQYDFFWLPDDDLYCTSQEVATLFQLCDEYELAIAQPALTRPSPYNLKITRHRRLFKYRLTNFVEIMCPLLSKEALLKVIPTFAESLTGWGVEYVWCQQLMQGKRTGIIDQVQVEHTRPGNAPKRGQSPQEAGGFYAARNLDPRKEQETNLGRYNLTPEYPSEYGGQTTFGLSTGRKLTKLISYLDRKSPF